MLTVKVFVKGNFDVRYIMNNLFALLIIVIILKTAIMIHCKNVQ